MSRIVVFMVSVSGLLIGTATTGAAAEADVTEPSDQTVEDIEVTISESADPNDEQVDLSISRTGNGSSGPGQRSEPLPPGWECQNYRSIENDLVQAVYDFTDGTDSGVAGADRVRATLDNSNGTFLDTGATVDPRDDQNSYDTTRQYSPSGQWAWIVCTDADGETRSNDLFPIGGAPVTLGGLFGQAMNQIDPPVHDFEMRPEGKQLVQFPSLLWVEPDYWNTDRSATVGNGNLSLTVSLVPFETEWDPGDGSDPIICDGPGDVWSRGVDSETLSCKHIYRSVLNQPFTLTSTVRFEVQWQTNSNEILGPFAPLERVDTAEVGVREIQVVESNA